MIRLKRTTSNDPDFQALVRLLDKELLGEYGGLQQYYNQFNQVPDLSTVVVAYDGEVPAGCGCFKPFAEGAVEIKRMYVKETYRGSGAAAAILSELEAWAREQGFVSAVLETGNKQRAALRFYNKQGYRVIDNYGQYTGIETSICMEKPLVIPGADHN